MPLRSVFSIDVDASAFNEFQKTFDKYQTALNQLPNAWAKVNSAATSSKDNFIGMASALMAQTEMLHKSQIEAEKLKNHATATNLAFSGLLRSTTGVARNIAEATKSLLSWTSVVSALGGLLGAGGLFGIERLASNAGNIRREAMGMGMSNQYTSSAPAMQAFTGVYGRLLNSPQGFLHSVNAAMNSAEGQATLIGAGLTPGQFQGRSTSDVATALLPRIRDIARRAPQGQLRNTLDAYHIGGLVTDEEAIRIRDMSDKELGGLQNRQKQIASDPTMRLKDETLSKWQDLNLVLGQAATRIENTLIRGLVHLAPGIEKLSDAFSTFVSKIVDDKDLPVFLDKVSEGLKEFGEYLLSDEFQKDTKQFISSLKELATEIIEIVKRLYEFTGGAKSVWEHNIPGHESYAGPLTTDPNSRPFSWHNPGTYLYHKPGTAPWEHGASGAARGLVGGQNSTPTYGNAFGEAISRAEGTFGPNGINYNATYNSPGYPSPPKPLTEMTVAEVQAWAKTLPPNTAPVGAYQIQGRTTLGGAAAGLRMDPNTTLFNGPTQDRMRDWIATHQGLSAWAGFRTHPAELAAAQSAMRSRMGEASASSGSGIAEAASHWLGMRSENPALRKFVHDATNLDPKQAAWCAAFANATLASKGIQGTGSQLAASFAKWGEAVSPDKAKADDIMVLKNMHHVGIATGEVNERGQLGMISGNSRIIPGDPNGGHQVGHTWEDPNNVVIRRGGGAPVAVHMTVNNNTGGNATVSTSQVAGH